MIPFLSMINNPIPLPEAKGIVTCEAGAKPKPHELTTAIALANAGYNIRFISNNKTIGMADCYVNNTIFEIKAPEGKSTACIERNLRKAVNHQSGNIIIDSFRVKNIQDRSIKNFLIERLKLKHGIKRILFVNRKRSVIDINKLIK